MKSGTISEDFPLHHNQYIPTFRNPNERNYIHKRAKINNLYTNEHPDLFRLEGMKEGGYFNPFLNKIIKVDRNEFFKKLSLDRKNINFIDFIKTNRKYSQNPNISKYISSDLDVQLRRKRMAQKNKNYSYSEIDSNFNNYRNYALLSEDNKNKIRNEYNNLLKTLNSFVPKIDYRIKKTLKISEDGNKNNNINMETKNLYSKLTNKNGKFINNLRNLNNFRINKEFSSNNEEFSFKRKQINQYNPMRDRREIIEPPPYKNEKWSSFVENYYLIAGSGKKFQRTGGLLTEFCNRNITSINNDKKKINLKLKGKKPKLFEKINSN